MLLTNLLQKSGAVIVFERLFGGIFRRILRLPESAVTPVIFGLIGGYPAGAVLTFEQYKTGALTADEACKIMRFNLCGGLAFTITAVGGYYGSIKTGALLYCASLFSSTVIAIFSAITSKSKSGTKSVSEPLPLSDALCKSAEASGYGIIIMSAYIILFCAIARVLSPPQFLTPLLEITSGIFTAKEKIPLPYCAFFLTFGGLSVHLQIAGMLAKMRVKYIGFLIYRTLGAVLSFGFCKAYCLLFPQSATVFSDSAVAVPFQFSESASFGILAMLGCAVLVLDIENRKIRL